MRFVYLGKRDGKIQREYAHRLSYRLFVGPIPSTPRHEIHHTCANPSCINPDHLRCLTRSEHARLNESSLRPTCIHGHPRTSANTYTTAAGHRMCRVCAAEAARKRRRERGLKGGPGARWRERTHCSRGHEYRPETTAMDRAKNARICLVCRRENQKRYRDAKRAPG